MNFQLPSASAQSRELGSASVADGANKIPFVLWNVMWLLGGVVALVSLTYDVIRSNLDHMPGRDFTNLWTAGKLVWKGEAACAFDPDCFRLALIDNLHMPSLQNYSYPPHALFLAAPFALMPYYVALGLWSILGVVFFNYAAKPYLPKGFPPLLAAFTPAGTINLWNGHYGFVLGGLWLLFFHHAERRPRLAGVLAGLLTFKPHLGIMIAATMLRRRATLVAAFATCIALVVISSIAFGVGPWADFLFGTSLAQHQILTRQSTEFYFRMMPTAYVTFGKGNIGTVAQLVCALVAIALLGRRGRWDAFSASTATFLIIPDAFNYDMTVAGLGFVILLFQRWETLPWWCRVSLVLAFFTPELTYFAAQLVPPILISALYVQLKLNEPIRTERPHGVELDAEPT
jgi:alpha-1,2-mannosyltransferase